MDDCRLGIVNRKNDPDYSNKVMHLTYLSYLCHQTSSSVVLLLSLSSLLCVSWQISSII